MQQLLFLLSLMLSACGIDDSKTLAPLSSGKITVGEVPVGPDSLYCRDQAFWRAYCDRWGHDLAHGGCEAISACTATDTAGIALIESDTVWVAADPTASGWLRVPQKFPATRLQRWVDPDNAGLGELEGYQAEPAYSLGLVAYPFRTSRGKRTLYGFPSAVYQGTFPAAPPEEEPDETPEEEEPDETPEEEPEIETFRNRIGESFTYLPFVPPELLPWSSYEHTALPDEIYFTWHYDTIFQTNRPAYSGSPTKSGEWLVTLFVIDGRVEEVVYEHNVLIVIYDF